MGTSKNAFLVLVGTVAAAAAASVMPTGCARDSQEGTDHATTLASQNTRTQTTQPNPQAPQTQVIAMAVTSDGFVPAEVKVKAGLPVKLVVTRQVERTCATAIVIKDFGVNKLLPLNKAVEVELTPIEPGKARYACAMDMIAGVLVVE
ncbi:MAG: cupredoxin domain-containing protein [Pseudomonadota bacterium]